MKNKTYNLVVSGLLIAVSIVLTRIFSKDLLIAGVPASRLSIGYLPIILSGMILGPVWGSLAGALADALGFALFPSGVFNPLITLTSALVGLLPALIVRACHKQPDWLKVLLSVTAVQVICTMFVQTAWLALFYFNGKNYFTLFFPRATVAFITLPIYYILVYSIMAGLKRANLLPSTNANKKA